MLLTNATRIEGVLKVQYSLSIVVLRETLLHINLYNTFVMKH